LVGAWVLMRWTLPWWSNMLAALGEGLLRSLEPWPLTTDVRPMGDGSALQVLHVYARRVPEAVRVDLLPLAYGLPLWIGLACAAPRLPWRRRLRDLVGGGFVLAIAMVVAFAARVHHNYATIDEDPFPAMFDNWRGWMAYFVNMFFLEVGFFVVPLALALALHRRAWASLLMERGRGS
jgi:hypothetical protein